MINKDTIPTFDPKKPFKSADSLPEFDPLKPFSEKKNPVQNVSPTGTQPLNRGLDPFQAQVDTKTPSVLTPTGQVEYQEQVKSFKPQPIVATPKEEAPDFFESVKNSLSNIGTGVQQFIPNTQIALSSTLEGLLGKDLGSDFYKNIVGSTHDPELDRHESYAKLAELEPQFKKTRGLIESAENFDAVGLAAATIDAMSSLVRTAITSVPTAGFGLVSDMVGGSIATYNQEKAKSKGISIDELYRKGDNEFAIPASIGAVGAGLEAIGLKGTIGLINKKLTGSFAKKLATTFVDVNKEGLTEFLQTGLDASNKALSQGSSAEQAGKVAVDQMFSKKGLESYLMGVVGSAGASGVGRVAKGMLPTNKKKATEATQRISEMESELNNPNISPATQTFISDNIKDNISEVADAIEADANEVEGLSTEQKTTINSVNEIIDSYEQVLSDPNASEQTKKLAQERINGLDLEVDNILKGKNISTETEVLVQEQIDSTTDTEAQITAEAQQAEATPTEIGGYEVTGEVESVNGERVFTVNDENGQERYLTADGKELQLAKQKVQVAERKQDDDAISDIQRRRQEELDSNKIERRIKAITFKDGNTVGEMFPVFGEFEAISIKEMFKEILTKDQLEDIDHYVYLKNPEFNKKINAKYDAELAALENTVAERKQDDDAIVKGDTNIENQKKKIIDEYDNEIEKLKLEEINTPIIRTKEEWLHESVTVIASYVDASYISWIAPDKIRPDAGMVMEIMEGSEKIPQEIKNRLLFEGGVLYIGRSAKKDNSWYIKDLEKKRDRKLAELEKQTKQTKQGGQQLAKQEVPVSEEGNVVAKKADIDRRRKEELNAKDKQSGEFKKDFHLNADILKTRRIVQDFIDTNGDVENIKDWNDLRGDLQTLLFEGKIDKVLSLIPKTYSEKINAKYDAELAELEKQTKEGGQNATQIGNEQINNQLEYSGTTEQQQGQQEDRLNQEEPVAEPKTKAGDSNQLVEGRKVKEEVAADAGIKVVVEEHKALHKELNGFKKSIGKAVDKYVAPDIAIAPVKEQAVVKEVGTKQQIENFGVPKEDVEASSRLLDRMFDGLKKAGLTTIKEVKDWVKIGKGTVKVEALNETVVTNALKSVANLVGFNLGRPIEKRDNALYTTTPLPKSTNVANGYEIIKKKLGETTARAIREHIPFALDYPNEFIAFITKRVPVKEDIPFMVKQLGSRLDVLFRLESDKNVKTVSVTKTPEELSKQAKYVFHRPKSEEDIMVFKKDFQDGEVLCTYNNVGGRINSNFIFWIRRNNAESVLPANKITQNYLKGDSEGSQLWRGYLESNGRKNSDGSYNLDNLSASRQDPYGTSSMSVQIGRSKGEISIKNRYNHTVSNPDATFGNDLNNIIDGLHDAVYNIDGVPKGTDQQLGLPDNILSDSSGNFFRFDTERNNVSFSQHGYLKGGVITLIDKSTQRMVDDLLIDSKTKTIISVVEEIDPTDGITKISFEKDKIIIQTHNGDLVFGLENGVAKKLTGDITSIGDHFLNDNNTITSIDLPNVTTIGQSFLYYNKSITSINLPNVTSIGDHFLNYNNTLTSIDLPKVTSIGHRFLYYNNNLTSINLPKVASIGDNFLNYNYTITSINLPNVTSIGHSFLNDNNTLISIDLPKVTSIGDGFLYYNNNLTSINLPKVASIGDHFLNYNYTITSINLPNVTSIGHSFLNDNNTLISIDLPKVTSIGHRFLYRNKNNIKVDIQESDNTPLYKDDSGEVQAQYYVESGKNTIEAIKDFNKSKNKSEATVALTHEIIHPTVVSIIDGAKEGNEVGVKHTETIVSEFNKANPTNKVTIEDLIKGNDAFKGGKTSAQYRSVQEFIADSWERYHTEGGKGFSESFQAVLDQISKAFQSVYKSITGQDLTPELRQMFDEILGKESPPKSISTAESVKSKEQEAAPIKLSTSVQDMKISDISTDEQRFQNRDELDEKRVKYIVANFDVNKFDPIVILKEGGKNIVLSGHHRLEAAKRLGMENIPVKIFEGTEQQAKDFAKDSNTLGKQETPIERAKRYRELRESGTPDSQIHDMARQAHGKDASFIVNLSRLDPQGKATEAIKQFEGSTDKDTKNKVQAVGDWIGQVKSKHPDLSRRQENEMFDYLMDAYSTKRGSGKITNKSQFFDLADALITRLKAKGSFSPESVINFKNSLGKSGIEVEYDATIKEAIERVAEANKALLDKRKDLLSRGANKADLDRVLPDYETAVQNAIKDLDNLRKQKGNVGEAVKQQTSIFDSIVTDNIKEDGIIEQQVSESLGQETGTTEKNEGDIGQPKATEAVQPKEIETVNKPFRIFKGTIGKKNADGTVRTAHPNVKGIFGSTDIKSAERYSEEGETIQEFNIPAGTTVETVEVKNTNQGLKAIREQETDLINNSKAQVVRLLTIDAKGREEQYIIKDKKLLEERKATEIKEPTEDALKDVEMSSSHNKTTGITKTTFKLGDITAIVLDYNETEPLGVEGAPSWAKKEHYVENIYRDNNSDKPKGLGRIVLLKILQNAKKNGADIVTGKMVETSGQKLRDYYKELGFNDIGSEEPFGIYVDIRTNKPIEFIEKVIADKNKQKREGLLVKQEPTSLQSAKDKLAESPKELTAKEELNLAIKDLKDFVHNSRNQTTMGANVIEFTAKVAKVIAAYAKLKITELEDVLKRMREDFGDDFVDDNEEAIQDAWNEAKGGEKKTVGDSEGKSEEKPEGSRGKRMTTQRVLSGTYRKAFKDAMTEKAIYYKELPNDLTEEEAQTIIDIKGIGEAEALVFDMNNGLSLPVRFTIAQKLIDNYERSGETLKAVDIFERIVEKITDTAQGLQSLTTWPKLSKASNVAQLKKTIQTQRNKFKKQTEKITTKIDKEFKKANKEAAEETVKVIQKAIDANTKLNQGGVISDLPLGYGTKNKVFTRDRYLKAKKTLRGMALSGVPIAELVDVAGYHIEATGRDFARFSRRMKADIGSKVKPFLKDLYGQARESLIKDGGYEKSLFLTDKEIDANIQEQEGQVWKEKLEKAIDNKDEKAQKVAIKKLQEISKDEGIWGQYKESAAKKLKGMVLTNIEKDISGNPSLQQFTDGLVKNMRQKMAELLPEKTNRKSVPRPDIEIIGDAYKNMEAYKEVWEQTQREFQEKYADQPEVLEAIDEYFGEILDKPFSDRLIEGAVKKGLKDLGTNIADLVVQHYTVIDNVGQTLAGKLVNEAGLTGSEAASLANAVQKEFDRIATKKKEDILKKMFSKNERKKPAIKTLEGEIIKLTNLGAFRTDALVEAYGDKMGWPTLKEENIKEIERLSDIVQNTDSPIKKRRAVEDLLAYQAKIKGVSTTELVTAIWYANVLSGYNTQIVNFGANAINTALLYANLVSQSAVNSIKGKQPFAARFIARGLMQGTKRGWLEAKETLKTGYNPIKGMAEVPSLLERRGYRKWNPLSYLKYVRRVMIAADVIAFEQQKEMRAYQMAMIQASKELRTEPTEKQLNRAIEIVGNSDRQIEAIKEQVELEHEAEIDAINKSSVSQEEKTKLINQANRDKPRRVFDLVEQQRSAEIIEETANFAAEGTYNYPPKGVLGAVAGALNKAVEHIPVLRYAVPFTNIIANVANETVNYTPLAFTRLKKGGYSNFRREQLTDQQRVDLMTKAIIGTTLMTTAFILSNLRGDDDEPVLEITSNGTGDFAKNATLKEQGWQEYSIRVKLPSGEYSDWYSYQYSPLILALGYVGHVNDLVKYKEEKDDDSIISLMSKAAGLTSATLFQATYLEGFGDLLQTISDPRSTGGTIDKVIKGVLGAAKGVIMPNLISQSFQSMNRTFDIAKKEVRPTGGLDIKNLLGNILQDIPFARDMYYDKVNILGDPIYYDTDKFHSADKPNKIIQLLIDKKAVFAPMNRKAEKIYDIELGRERVLTDEEFFNYSMDKGQYIKQSMEANYGKYKEMTNVDFKKELSKVKELATISARHTIMDIGTKLIDIVQKEEGEFKTYRMNPEQVKIATEIISIRLNEPSQKKLRKEQINRYITNAKLSIEDAEKKTDLLLNDNATKYAKNKMLAEHNKVIRNEKDNEPKYKLELK